MKKIISYLCLCVFSLLIVETLQYNISVLAIANSSSIVISKIAAFETSGYEWVEICNRSGGAIDTNGWKFFEDGKNHGWGELKDDDGKLVKDDKGENAHREDLVLVSGECAVIVQDENKFLENHENWNSTIIDSAWSSLKESGEEIGIKDADGEIVEMFTYIPCPDDVLERVDLNLDIYDSSNWVEKEQIDTDVEQITHNIDDEAMTDDVSANTGSTDNEIPQFRSAPFGMTNKEALNNPPVAVMGSDLEINAGDTVFFDGSDSFDEDGDTLEYSWDFGDGGEGEGVKIEHTYLHSGKMSAILRVCDGEWTSSDAIWIDSKAVKYAEHVFINAFLPNPIGPDTQDEWIEICNDGPEIADLSNWRLDDITDGGSKEFLIKNVDIAPEKCFRFMRSDTKIAINNDGDDIRLLNPAGDVVDQISFDKSATSDEVFSRGENIQTLKHVSIQTDDNVADDETGTQVLEDEMSEPGFSGISGIILDSPLHYDFGGQAGLQDGDVTYDEGNYMELPLQVTDELVDRNVPRNISMPMAVRTGDVLGGTLDGEIVKISGNIIEKSGNVFFVDDGSGEIRIHILPKTKIKYTDIIVGDQITIDGEISKTQIGYRILPNSIEKK